jgi:predicted nucleic acid-binding protein
MIICDTGDFSAIELTASDYARSAELVVTYGDLPLGTTDASVIAIAERLKLTEVATLDRRHFTVVRPVHVDTLTLLPQPPQAPTVTTRSRQRW